MAATIFLHHGGIDRLTVAELARLTRSGTTRGEGAMALHPVVVTDGATWFPRTTTSGGSVIHSRRRSSRETRPARHLVEVPGR